MSIPVFDVLEIEPGQRGHEGCVVFHGESMPDEKSHRREATAAFYDRYCQRIKMVDLGHQKMRPGVEMTGRFHAQGRRVRHQASVKPRVDGLPARRIERFEMMGYAPLQQCGPCGARSRGDRAAPCCIVQSLYGVPLGLEQKLDEYQVGQDRSAVEGCAPGAPVSP